MPDPSDDPSPTFVPALVVLVAAVAAGFVLRVATTSDLWLDEALSVNIASLPLSELTEALRQDGHPPLYYVLLHGWMELFGDGDVAVRALSGVLSLLTLPLLGVMAHRRRGPAAALWTVVIAAVLPYATRYATEARMYALVMFLVALGWWLIDRALDEGGWASVVGLWVVATALLYTHYWGVWIAGVTGVAMLVVRWRAEDPARGRAALRCAGALVAAAVAFLPWLPVMLDQLERTGTPWGDPQRPTMSLAISVLDVAGGWLITEAIIGALMLGLLVVIALTGRPRPPASIELDLRTVPGVRADVAVAGAALLVGTSITWITGATFASRYAAIVVPILIVAAGVGVAVAPRRSIATALGSVVALVLLVTAVAGAVDERTQGGEAAAAIASLSAPGDVVLVCPDQLGPALSRGIPDNAGLEVLTYPSLEPPERVDWRDYEERNQAADLAAIAAEVRARAGGSTIWLVWMGGYATYDVQCEEIRDLLASDGLLDTVVVARPDEAFEPMWVERISPVG